VSDQDTIAKVREEIEAIKASIAALERLLKKLAEKKDKK
jgi:ubiquinone biosynthesis protein UbiJ